jgi:hypothetical protein
MLSAVYSSFSQDTLVPFRVRDKWGFSNIKGEIIVQPFTTEFPEPVSPKLFKINRSGTSNYRYELINERGSKIGTELYSEISKVHDDMLLLESRDQLEKGHYKFYNILSSTIVELPSTYTYSDDFSEGLAPFVIEDSNGKDNWGLINKKGEVAIQPTYKMLYFFKDGICPVINNNKGEWVLIDRNEKLISPSRYYDIFRRRADGVMIVNQNSGEGLLSSIGKEILPCKFTDVDLPFYGIIMAKDTSYKYGIFDMAGREIVKPKFIYHGTPRSACIPVREENRSLLLDKEGAIIAIFPDSIDFVSGPENELSDYILVVNSITHKPGLMDQKGKLIVPFIYDDIRSFVKNTGVACNDGKCGLIDNNGKQLTAMKYSGITYVPELNLWEASVNHKLLGYINTNGKQYWID